MAQTNDEANQLIREIITESSIVGIAAGYTVAGVVQWENAAGFSSKENETPFTVSTLTRMASVAKSMTAIAVMQLVEKGKIGLDEPVRTYLPQFPEKKKGTITVRHLLSHTSGLTGYQSTKEAESQTEYPDLEAAMQVFQGRDLLFEPGTGFFYTTHGYVVLGRIIEVVSDLSFGEYMQQNIWDKAGMMHTGIEKMNATYSNKSELYHKNKKRAKKRMPTTSAIVFPAADFTPLWMIC